MSGQPHHGCCAEALEHVIALSSRVTYNSLLELELVEAAYKAVLRDQHGKKWRSMRHDGRARRPAARTARKALDAWAELADLDDFHRVEASAVTEHVPALMHRYGLGSYDAVHVATASLVGADGILAIDTGFARVSESVLTIHAPTARVPRMRAIRG